MKTKMTWRKHKKEERNDIRTQENIEDKSKNGRKGKLKENGGREESLR